MKEIKLNTRFGELNINAAQIITFPEGLPGFESSKRWTLFYELDDKGESMGGVVMHLQSVDDKNLSLPLTNPSLFGFNYEMVLTDGEVAELNMEDASDILVLMSLYKNNLTQQTPETLPAMNIYANLSAPILINMKSRIGIQKILAGTDSKVNYSATVNL
ncbi:MAG: flagellar assembly protein FliW [Proteobacteria bacterium]|nr:flagellar assembly protein FliW [Pseudomonadota bacterium]